MADARRFLLKAMAAEPRFAPAWIAYGHAFAAQNESDQAMAAYRTAERLFKGSHYPSLFLGLEHVRANNVRSGQSFIMQSLTACPTDPLIYNELGVVHYRNRAYADAIACFERAVQLIVPAARPAWEPTFFNLGHCHRKRGEYGRARDAYEVARALFPRNASTYTAIGFTFDLEGDDDHRHRAIDHYHKALGLNPRDMLTSDLLSRALSRLFVSSSPPLSSSPSSSFDE